MIQCEHMSLLHILLDLFLHLDKHLQDVIAQYGTLTYLFLFLIIFFETGIVLAPFLPGDSLLFAAGALAIQGHLNILVLFVLFCIAAILGDTANYVLGAWIGTKVFSMNTRLLNKKHLEKTHAFYEKYGGQAVILGRFVPVIRTFVPFVAGVGAMTYARFLVFNIIGGIAWVALFLFAGYFFGAIPAVEHNFSLVILAVIVLSVLPAVVEWWRHRQQK